MKIETVVYTVPTWSLSYLINGDSTGMNDNDEKAVVQFEKDCNEYPREQGASHCHLSTRENEGSWFAPCNDITGFIGDDVEEIDLVMLFPDQGE